MEWPEAFSTNVVFAANLVDFRLSSALAPSWFTLRPLTAKYCNSPEGWGPVSPTRDFDLTPCFEIGIMIPFCAMLFIVAGVPRVWQLVGKAKTGELNENCRGEKSGRLLYGKLSLILLAGLAAFARTMIVAVVASPSPLVDPALYTSILEVIAFTVVVSLTYLNHRFTRRSSTTLLVCYPIYFVASFIYLRTLFEVHALRHSASKLGLVYRNLALTQTIFVFAAWILECVGPEMDDAVELTKAKNGVKESPYLTANFYSRLAFLWMDPLMKLGYKRFIVHEDLYDLEPDNSSGRLEDKLSRVWEKQKGTKEKPSLWRAMALAYGGPFALAGVLKVFSDLLQFAQPQYLRFLLLFISDYQRGSESATPLRGFALCGLIFFSALAQSAILHQYFQLCFVTGARVRAGLVMTIYRKALILSNDDKTARGDIVNLMSVDATRMQDLCAYLLMILSGPFQVMLAFISLYDLLGWPSFVGVAVMLIAVPINAKMARFLKTLQEKQMKNRDARTRMMSEVLNNIKSIKIYGWERVFGDKIAGIRNGREILMLRKIGIVNAIISVFWSTVPLFVALASFVSAAYAGDRPLTADIIFPCISLFMLLQFPLGMFAMITTAAISASVSASRMRQFLLAPELQEDARVSHAPPEESSDTVTPQHLASGDKAVSFKDGEFKWLREAVNPTLEDINLVVNMGELVGVFGRVGCGKTSLLSAIVGEMMKTDGTVDVFGSVAYAPQNPWIMSATVRDNITFFRRFDPDFYEIVLEACALKPDLALLPDGDMTEVGEKGITLSGGQRARISLARCVYARADVYLLDDVLAAVDAHVSRHLFDKVIGPRGLLSQKARIVVTNSVASVREYDNLILIRRGIILERGSYEVIMQKPGSELCKLITEFSSKGGSSSNPTSGSATPITSDNGSTLAGSLRGTNSILSADGSAGLQYKLQASLQARPPILSSEEQRERYASSLSLKSTQFVKESSEQGKVKGAVYGKYLEAASKVGVALFAFSILAQQALTIWSNLVLRSWGEKNRETGTNTSPGHFLFLYSIPVLAACAASLLSGILLWVYCAVRSARALHDSMLGAIFRAPLGWFERIPQGRVMNLFTKDVNVVDETLPRMFSQFSRTLAAVLGIIVVMGASLPLSLIAVVPLAIVYHRYMTYYLATSRELKRLDAVSRSPIFAWFQESLGGLSTIRAFQMQGIFRRVNELRSDTNLQAYLPSTYVNRWLAVRLEFLGSCVVLVAAVLSVTTVVVSDNIDSGLVGLVLSYAISTTGSLNWVIRSAGDVEQNIVSVERILTYVNVEPEAPSEIPETKPADGWPQTGEIRLENYSMRYRTEHDLVLRDVNLVVRPGERLGICGRTGAGKSSLILGLLRINEPASGTIYVDGIDITAIGLHNLRSTISIIPQEPQLFTGSIRQNVDVTETSNDDAIWRALEQVHLKQTVSSLGGLDAEVREGGSSLSAGQRQLICFARALIRKSKILILDEATSAVDLESDQAIQDVLRSSYFEGVTRLTVAHRLHTIIESDRILVLDAGKVAELDTPQKLLSIPGSIFASLAAEAGIS
ncbi:metal resistance protein YCF1 [Cantharellus anzutake]|uniref:metal resistance protein YCF1 n=1 Tax=Cantharellus anzutake TaxID=1750568 RepID=UPI00190560C3|nr:metal resistance protein YCF1 [Cantharellus anzutake]KAF8340537.1 metal resistance protein YCF1 [Cantharellus anzutake]